MKTHTSNAWWGRGLVLLTLILSAVITTSCARKPTAVDPSYSTPEGVVDTTARLMMWPEQEAVTLQYTDNPPFGPDADDLLIGPVRYSRRTPGTRNGIILDGTIANSFEVLRREPNGGLLQFLDFPLVPRERWLDGHGDIYQFTDEAAPGASVEYVARGLVGGVSTPQSPLSNTAMFSQPLIGAIPLRFPTDTTVIWDAVPGAQTYIAHIFQFSQSTPMERVLASAPIPVYVGQSRDFFLGISTQPDTVGRSQRFRGTVLTNKDMTPGQYLCRITALDAAGNLIASSVGDSAVVQGDGFYEVYATGAATLPRPRIIFGPGRTATGR